MSPVLRAMPKPTFQEAACDWLLALAAVFLVVSVTLPMTPF